MSDPRKHLWNYTVRLRYSETNKVSSQISRLAQCLVSSSPERVSWEKEDGRKGRGNVNRPIRGSKHRSNSYSDSSSLILSYKMTLQCVLHAAGNVTVAFQSIQQEMLQSPFSQFNRKCYSRLSVNSTWNATVSFQSIQSPFSQFNRKCYSLLPVNSTGNVTVAFQSIQQEMLQSPFSQFNIKCSNRLPVDSTKKLCYSRLPVNSA